MSYNITKVSSKTANSTGDITLNVADVSSVSSPQADQVLAYNGSNWVNRSPNWVNAYEESAHNTVIQAGVTNITTIIVNYPISPPYLFRFYNQKTNNTNYGDFTTTSDVTALADSASGGKTAWFYGFRFNTAGVYKITAKIVAGPNSTDTSFVDLQLSNDNNTITYGPRFRVGSVSVKQRNIVGIVNASVNDEVGFYKHGIVDNPKYSKLGDENILVIVERLS